MRAALMACVLGAMAGHCERIVTEERRVVIIKPAGTDDEGLIFLCRDHCRHRIYEKDDDAADCAAVVIRSPAIPVEYICKPHDA